MPPLLGRSDLFDRFRIIFDQSKRVVIFEDNSKGSNE